MHRLYINAEGPFDYTYDVNVETIDVSTLGSCEPDPNWFTSDINGHFHTFDKDGDTPTLERRYNAEFDLLDGFFCKLCGNDVVPNFRSGGPKHQSIPMQPEVTIVIKGYPTLLAVGTQVTFNTSDHFGIARVTHTHCQPGLHCSNCTCPLSFDVTLLCDAIAARNQDANLSSL